MTETTLTAERLIGRFGMVASVVDCLLDANGPGALILGDAGVGKTALTHEVLFELGIRVSPFYVYAGPSLAEVPYAALAPLLTSLTPGQTDQPRAVLKALVTELNPEGQRDPSQAVLVVEDAHHLDDSSAAVISAAGSRGSSQGGVALPAASLGSAGSSVDVVGRPGGPF